MHDIRFVEDDWENPTVGAWGLGWEVWCDGMEVSQYTYFQQVGGIDVEVVAGELTYGLERLAMYVFGVDRVYDLPFNEPGGPASKTYGDVFLENERQQSEASFHGYDVEVLKRQFEDMERQAPRLLGMTGPQGQPLVVARLRSRAEILPFVQPDGRARRHRRGRTPELYRPHPRPDQGVRRSLGGGGIVMPQLLLELFSEEIPARMQAQAGRDLTRMAEEHLKKAGLVWESLQAFTGPRRLTLVVEGLPAETPARSEEIKGPRANAPDQAIEGFLRKTGLTRADLTERDGVFFSRCKPRRAVKPQTSWPRPCPRSWQPSPGRSPCARACRASVGCGP